VAAVERWQRHRAVEELAQSVGRRRKRSEAGRAARGKAPARTDVGSARCAALASGRASSPSEDQSFLLAGVSSVP